MIVEWSDRATERLREIVRTIALERGFIVARRWKAKLEGTANQLASFPRIGAETPEFRNSNIREVGVPPYRVIYHVSRNRCTVLSVIHSRQSISSGNL